MNGSGIATSSARPSATAIPEKTTARPAVCIVRDDRVVDRLPGGELLPEAVDDEQRVVDRDPEPDQLHEVRRVGRRRPELRDPVDDPERAGDRAGGEERAGSSPPSENPNTASRTSSAIGSAISSSPCRRSELKTGSRSCWIAAAPVT